MVTIEEGTLICEKKICEVKLDLDRHLLKTGICQINNEPIQIIFYASFFNKILASLFLGQDLLEFFIKLNLIRFSYFAKLFFYCLYSAEPLAIRELSQEQET